ncbi:hypothetical protein RCC89_05380 [Cytophagaceae bacterium ABcell3]|nr:hypothetical protein RCC89_05380 [Cytophagaceae bacterium ABcell3]
MKKSYLIFIGFLGFFACEQPDPENGTVIATDTVEQDRTRRDVDAYHVVKDTTVEVGGISITPLEDSPEFADGILEMNQPEEDASFDEETVTFDYEITNFRLGHPTDTTACPRCSNSEKGQHIHLILNNQPYLARYETNFTETLDPGHYVSLSFLSRSYHESVKHNDAYVLRQFTVGDVDAEEVDLTKPFLFYSRPKDEYVGVEAEAVLLDFYLVNAELSENGYKVRATVDGNEFLLVRWCPFVMEGLPMGEVDIKLELLDADGNLVDTEFNPSERTITLREAPGA